MVSLGGDCWGSPAMVELVGGDHSYAWCSWAYSVHGGAKCVGMEEVMVVRLLDIA